MTKQDGGVYAESVRIRVDEDTIRSYVPRKGIDVIFSPVYDDEGEKKGKKEWNATLIGSNILPEYNITQRELVNELSKWRNIVSDRTRIVRSQPLKHKIVTNVDRELIMGSDILKSRIDNVDEKDIHIDPTVGKRFAEICDEEVKE